MNSTQVHADTAVGASRAAQSDLKLEVVVIPVSDVNRAKRFYEELGWRLDLDCAANKQYRVIQFTPPGFVLLDHLRQWNYASLARFGTRSSSHCL